MLRFLDVEQAEEKESPEEFHVQKASDHMFFPDRF